MKFFIAEIYESPPVMDEPDYEVWHKIVFAARNHAGAAKRALREARGWWSDKNKSTTETSTFRFEPLDGIFDNSGVLSFPHPASPPCPVWDSYGITHCLHSLKEITRADYEVLKRHL